jgi:hypothetical protein
MQWTCRMLMFDKYCTERWGDDWRGVKACTRNEQEYYEMLEVMWNDTLVRTKEYCMTLYRKQPNLYSPLAKCVLQMRERDQIETQAKFRH